MIYNTQIVSDDKDDNIRGPYKPQDYKYESPKDRFEQPSPNITRAALEHEPSLDSEDFEPVRARTREETRTIFGQWIMTEFGKKHPRYAGKLNFAAIVEVCNISGDMKRWYAQKRSEWANMVQFPDWAAKSLSSEQATRVQQSLQMITTARREKSIREGNASRYMSEVQERIEKNYLAEIEKVYRTPDGKTDWLPIIFSLTTDNLPIDKVIDIVDYRVKDANTDSEERSSDDYLHPAMYEGYVLDDFKKECFNAWTSGKDMKDFFKEAGVSFVRSDDLAGDIDLSDIAIIVKGKGSSKGKGGPR